MKNNTFLSLLLLICTFRLSNASLYPELTSREQSRPYYWWFSNYNESKETINGVYPTLSCPPGHYRTLADFELREPGGLREDGCLKCPAGYYGNSTSLQSPLCSAPCPVGTYRDREGAESIDDCKPCPKGTFGEEEGLTSKDCSGFCTDLNTANIKFYSGKKGLTTREDCQLCIEGYSHWQCEWEAPKFTEADHHYQNGHDEFKGNDIMEEIEYY